MKLARRTACASILGFCFLAGCTIAPDAPKRVSMYDGLVDESALRTSPQTALQNARLMTESIVLSKNTIESIRYMKEHAQKSSSWNPLLREDLKEMVVADEDPQHTIDELVLFLRGQFKSVQLKPDLTEATRFDATILIDIDATLSDWTHSKSEARLTGVIFNKRMERVATVQGSGSAYNPGDGSRAAYTSGIRSREIALRNFEGNFAEVVK